MHFIQGQGKMRGARCEVWGG